MNDLKLDIVPEFFKSGLQIRNGKYLKKGQLNVPERLFEIIEDFSLKATQIYPLGNIAKRANWDWIFEIDKVGYNLSLELLKEVPNVEVRYFSPGKNAFLSSPPKEEDYKVKLGFLEMCSRFIHRSLSENDGGESWKEFAKGGEYE